MSAKLYKNGNMHIVFTNEDIEFTKGLQAIDDSLITLSNMIYDDCDCLQLSEYWESAGNFDCSFRFYCLQNNRIYTVLGNELDDLMNGKKLIIKGYKPKNKYEKEEINNRIFGD